MTIPIERAAPIMGNGSNQTVLLGGLDITKNSINTLEIESKPPTCKKFNSCSAPQCPLDNNSLNSTYVKGERICPWFYEYVKGNHKKLKGTIGRVLFLKVGEAYFTLLERYRAITGRLEASKHYSSNLGGDID